MTEAQEKELFETFSRGEISRKELARRAAREITFGELIAKLRHYELTFPKYPSNAKAVALIKTLAQQARHG